MFYRMKETREICKTCFYINIKLESGVYSREIIAPPFKQGCWILKHNEHCRRVRDDLRISGYDNFDYELERLKEKLK